jgi:hypothetical protein
VVSLACQAWHREPSPRVRLRYESCVRDQTRPGQALCCQWSGHTVPWPGQGRQAFRMVHIHACPSSHAGCASLSLHSTLRIRDTTREHLQCYASTCVAFARLAHSALCPSLHALRWHAVLQYRRTRHWLHVCSGSSPGRGCLPHASHDGATDARRSTLSKLRAGRLMSPSAGAGTPARTSCSITSGFPPPRRA